MARARKVLSRLVGGIQCGLGGLAWTLAYLVYASQPMRDALAITSEEIALYVFLLLVFGMFSILSGLILVHEKESGI